MRNYREALQWYKDHQTARQIGFDPDGMCLKICRVARGIPSRYPSAKAAQDATPRANRVERVRDLQPGMVIYYDDPNDSNRFGHIVTMVGRRSGVDVDSLSSVLVETNSVKSNEVVVVQGDYFPRYWGDDFQFGATWLNGYELDYHKPVDTRVENFLEGGPRWDVKILDRAAQNRRDVSLIVRRIDATVNRLPNDRNNSLVRQFKDYYKKHRVIRMGLLNKAVSNGRVGSVKLVRDTLRQLIHKELPRK